MSWNGLGYVAVERQPAYYPIQPGVVLRKIRELDEQNRRINRAVDARTGAIADVLGTSFIADWAAYYGEWRLFVTEHEGWFSRFSSDAVETLADFINRSNRYDTQLQGVGVETGTVTREQREAEQEAGEAEGGIPGWAWTLIVLGGVVAGGYALYSIARVLREGRLIASEARGTAGIGGRRRRSRRRARTLGGPTRVHDLDGSKSTYNLEIR